MAKINDTTTFPNTAPALTDHVIGTDVSDTGNSADGEVVTFLLSDILALAGVATTKNLFGSGAVSSVDFDVTGYDGARFVIQARYTGATTGTVQVNVSDGTFGTAQTLMTVAAGNSATLSGYWDEATGSVQGAFGSDGAAASVQSATVTKTSGITTLRFTGVGSGVSFSVHVMPDGGES